ncbi:carboxylesterase/lipase family protein [Alsobacter sp. R-9]
MGDGRRRMAVLAALLTMLKGAPAMGAEVTIDSGRLVGVAGNGVDVFLGVPYAAPPAGALRWRAPQPVAAWSDPRPADRFGPDCMQNPVAWDTAPLGTAPAEDCLTVNVWTPAGAGPDRRHPVLVWIHGGGYVNGGSSAPVYDGSALARSGLVVVSLNYRLGRFGFFGHPALTAAAEGPTGNFGLMDQIAALRWVQRNIGAFGGDPGAVTAMGESAGGDSVIRLMTMRAAPPLFHRAIVMSGGGRRPLLGGLPLRDLGAPLDAESVGTAFARSVGIGGRDAAALAALRALPAAAVAGKLDMGTMADETRAGRYTGGPVVDGGVVTTTPARAFERGEGLSIPVMIGTTTDDLGLDAPASARTLLAAFGPDAKEATAAYNPDGRRSEQDMLRAFSADRTMHEPARLVARRVTERGQKAWLYRFGVVPQAAARAGAKGAAHASELPFAFGTLQKRFPGAVSPADEEASQRLAGAIAAFARTGDPNGSGLPAWTPFDPTRSEIMLFGPDGRDGMAPDPLARRIALVERLEERGRR